MDKLKQVQGILRDALNLGARADKFTMDTPLLGSVPEFDSMAVVQVITMMEEECGICVQDDELSAEIFSTVGSLVQFLSQKSAA